MHWNRLHNSISERLSAEATLLAAVHRFARIALAWHGDEPVTACTDGGIEGKALHLHAMNFLLWHREDAVRRPGVGDHEVARGKRAIDNLNARRNVAIEDIDVMLLDRFTALRRRNIPLHTETPGMIVDRLSVLTLRILHTDQATRLAVLDQQYDDLIDGLSRFLASMRDGEITFTVYRQFKSAEPQSFCALDRQDMVEQTSTPGDCPI